MASFTIRIYLLSLICALNYAQSNAAIHSSPNCTELGFTSNLVLMIVYFCIVSIAGYLYGRHRGEYILETRCYHKLWMWFLSYLLLYMIIISWIYYNFFHSANDINYITEHFPWLTVYGFAYTAYSLLSTFSFAHHSKYDNAALMQFVCLLCTIFPLGLAILTFFMFQKSKHIQNYKLGLFDVNAHVLLCANIDVLSLVLTVLLLVALLHHCCVLLRVCYGLLSEEGAEYLSHPHAYHGRVSDASRPQITENEFDSQQMYGMSGLSSRLHFNKQYVYKSDESDSDDAAPDLTIQRTAGQQSANGNAYQDEQEIEINVQIPIYRRPQNALTVPRENVNVNLNVDGGEESVQLNQSMDIHSALPTSLSYDL